MQTRNRGKTPQKGDVKQEQKNSVSKKSAKKNNNFLTIETAEPELLKSPSKSPSFKVNKSNFVQSKEKQDLYDQYKRYKTRDVIGEGAFGKIYRITTKETNEIRAMKIIDKKKLPITAKEEFINEIEILKQLDHPNVIKIYDVFDDSQNYYLITEFIEGCDLLKEIWDQDSLSESYVANLMKQIFSGLNYTHQNNLVHRDIKPENLMIEKYRTNTGKKHEDSQQFQQNYTIKIIDWGTGVKFDDEKGFLTEKCGSIDYASPEVFKGKYDQKCDMWSCGIILYILLSGEHPFGQVSMSTFDMENQIKKAKYNFESENWEDVSDNAKDLVNKLLCQNATKRITAQQALQHPWFTEMGSVQMNTQDTKNLNTALRRIKQFKTETTLQDAVVTYIASHLTTKHDREQLSKTFKVLDKNGDGELSKEEILEGYTQLMPEAQAREEVEKIFERIDIDGNGSISYTEFIAASMDKTSQFSDIKLKEAFKLFDKDGDGEIESKEIKQVLGGSLKDNNIDEKIWDDIIKEVDVDQNGTISFDEFKIFMQKMISTKK